jgi:hypothetical protein
LIPAAKFYGSISKIISILIQMIKKFKMCKNKLITQG